MKFRFTVFYISFIIANLHGQSYPFPIEEAEWHTSHVSSQCTGGSNRHYYWTEFLGGDTLINEEPYTKLMLWPHCIYINAGTHCPEEFIYPEDGINAVGGIREINNQVLFLKFNVPDSLFISYEECLSEIPAGEEIILFDYNWLTGDSVIYPQHNGDPLIFDIIGTNVAEGRKSFGLQQRGQPAWYNFQTIEGMGGKQGLFNMYYANQLAGIDLGVDVCFIDNGVIVQEGSCTSPCELVHTNDLVHEQLRLYPNPTDDEFTIRSSTTNNPSIIKFYNLFGQLVYCDTHYEQNESISARRFRLNGWLYVVGTDISGQISTGILQVY